MTKQFTTDSPTFDEIRALRKPRTKTVWVPLDADLLARIDELEREVRIAAKRDETENRPPEAPRLRAELEHLQTEAEAAAVAFTFSELPRKQYRDLIAAHPDPDGKLRWAEETFAPALLAACATSPTLTPSQAQELWDEWGDSVAYALFDAAYLVNEGPTKIPFGARSSAATPDSEPSSDSASATDDSSDTTSS